MPNILKQREEQQAGPQAPAPVVSPAVSPAASPVQKPFNPYEFEAGKSLASYYQKPGLPNSKPGELELYLWKQRGNLNVNYKPSVVNSKKPYWAEPQRVVRYKQLLDTTPPDVPIPEWVDKEKIDSLYNYLEYLNPGKPSDQWDAINEADPNYRMVETLTSPPQDLLPNADRDPVFQANTIIDNWRKRYEEQYAEYEKRVNEYNAEFADQYAADVAKQNEVDFSKLEPFQQFLVATQAITPGKNKPEWMNTVEKASLGYKTGMGAMGAATFLTSTIGAAATGGSGLGPIGTAIGAGIGLGAGVYAYLKAESGDLDGAMKIMSLFNKPAEWTEQAIGANQAMRQLAAYGADTSKIKYKDFFEAGRSFYESNFYQLGNLETNIISQAAHFLNPNWSSGKTADVGEVWQIQKGLVDPQAIREGTMVGLPLVEATMRLYNGEDSTTVYEDMVDRYGYSGTRTDFILQSWVDPTQYLPFAISLAGEKISGWAKNPLLADSFKNMRGNILADAMPGNLQMPVQMAIGLYNRIVLKNTPDGGTPHFINFKPSGGLFDVVDDYRYKLRTATSPLGVMPKMTDDFTGFDRIIAGIDRETGMPKESMAIDTQGGVANKRMRNILSDKTPLAKIVLLKDNLAGAIENIWERSHHDINQLTEQLNKVIAGKASVVTGDAATYFYDSPEARALAGALKAGMGDKGVKNIMAAWEAMAPQRSILNEMASALKVNPENILLRIEKGETSALIDEFMNSGVGESNNTYRSLKNNLVDAEGFAKKFKTMIRDKIPVNENLMFVRFQQELDKGMGSYLAKNYGVPENEAAIFRGARLNKSIQSLVLLGLNPTFLVKNFLNNVSTMAYQRVGGIYSADLNAAVYTKYGITPPARAGEGYSMIGVIPKSKEGSKDLIDKAQNAVSKVTEKAAVISNTSMKIEQACSESVVATGVDYVMRQDVLSGNYFGNELPEPVKAELRAKGYNPEDITSLMKVTFNTDDLGKGPNKKLHVQVKMNEAVEAAFKKLNLDPAIGNDLLSKTGVVDALTKYMNEDGMSFGDAMATYKRTLDYHIHQLRAQELIDAYDDNAAVVHNSGLPGGVHILNRALQDEYTFDNLMQEKQYEAIEEARAIRRAAASGTEAEVKKAWVDANAVYHIRLTELDNIMQDHIEERLNIIAPVLNALDADTPEQARYIKAIVDEHNTYVKFQQDKMDVYDAHWDPETKADMSWGEIQAKVKELGDAYMVKHDAIRKETAEATIAIFGDDANVINKVKDWLEASAKIRAKIEETDKRFQAVLRETHGEPERDALWLERNQYVEKLQAQALDLDYQHGNAVNAAIRNMPPEPEVPDAVPTFEDSPKQNKGRHVTDPTGKRVWVTDEKPRVKKEIDPVSGEYETPANTLDQPDYRRVALQDSMKIAETKSTYQPLVEQYYAKVVSALPEDIVKNNPGGNIEIDRKRYVTQKAANEIIETVIAKENAGEPIGDAKSIKRIKELISKYDQEFTGLAAKSDYRKSAEYLQAQTIEEIRKHPSFNNPYGEQTHTRYAIKNEAEFDALVAKYETTTMEDGTKVHPQHLVWDDHNQWDVIADFNGNGMVVPRGYSVPEWTQTKNAKPNLDMTYDEYKVSADVRKRLININRIEMQKRGGWVFKNREELQEITETIRQTFHKTTDEARADVAILCLKAEDVTFRTGELDPMTYIRRYQYVEVDVDEFMRTTSTGVASAGTGRSSLDIPRGKWVIEATKKANATTWLHEMAHTWITDLDDHDINVLARWTGYHSGEEFMEAEKWFRTTVLKPGEIPDAQYAKFAKAQEDIVAAFEQLYYKRGAVELNDLQVSTIPAKTVGAFRRLMLDLRNWIVKLYQKLEGMPATGQARFMPKGHNSVYGIEISQEVNVALYHLMNGYRKDQVWLGSPDLQHVPVSYTYLDDLYAQMYGGKHLSAKIYDGIAAEDVQSVLDLAPKLPKKAAPVRATVPTDQVILDSSTPAEPEPTPFRERKKVIAPAPHLNYGKNNVGDLASIYYRNLTSETQRAIVNRIVASSGNVDEIKPGSSLYDYVKANKVTQAQLDKAIEKIADPNYKPSGKPDLEFQLTFRAITELKTELPSLKRYLNASSTDRLYNRLDYLDDTLLKPLEEIGKYGFDPNEKFVADRRYLADIDYIRKAYEKYEQMRDVLDGLSKSRAKAIHEKARPDLLKTYLDPANDMTVTPEVQARLDKMILEQSEAAAGTRPVFKDPTVSEDDLGTLISRTRISMKRMRKVIDAYEDYINSVFIKEFRQNSKYIDPSGNLLGGRGMLVDTTLDKRMPNFGLQDTDVAVDLSYKDIGYHHAESSWTNQQKRSYEAFVDRSKAKETMQDQANMSDVDQNADILNRSRILDEEPEPKIDSNVNLKKVSSPAEVAYFVEENMKAPKGARYLGRDYRAFEFEFENLYVKTRGRGPEWEAMAEKARNIRDALYDEITADSNGVITNKQIRVELLNYVESIMFPRMRMRRDSVSDYTFEAKQKIIQPEVETVTEFYAKHPNAMYQPDPGPALHNDIDSIPTTMKMGKTWQEQQADINIFLKTLKENYNADNRSYGYKGINKLSPENRALFDQWLADAGVQLGNAKQKAIRFGLAQRDSALLNYGDRNGFDNYLDMLFPYQFWFTRSMKEWVKRSLNRPSILALAGRRAQMAEKLGKEMGEYPARLQGKYKIPWAFAEPWMGDSIYVNPWQDLMPVNQLLQPLDMLNQQYTSLRPDLVLQEMVQSGEITQAQMDTSMANKNDELWQKAMATAQAGNATEDPYALLSMMMTPNWLINEVEAKISKRKLPNQPLTNLGLTMQSHADTIGQGDSKIGDAIHDALTWVGKAFEQPEKLIRGNNFAYYGQWGEWLVKRELSNMAAEGIPVIDVRKAMIEKRGDLWAQASKRVRDQVALKTPGSLLVRTIEEGEYVNMPWAIVATLFPAGIFPEGEMAQLGLKEDMMKAWDVAAQTGDKTLMNDWFKAHPEYMARAALNDDDATMLKKFLVNQIMDAYTSEANLNKSLIKAHLGDDFLNKILNPDTNNGKIDWKALDTEKLVDWARTLKKDIPITEETVQMNNPVGEIKKYSPEEITELTTFFDQREALFPDHAQLNERYGNLQTEKEKTIFLAKYPEIKEYWDWAKEYRAAHPVVKAWSEKYSDPDQVAQDPYFGLDPEKIDAYYQYKAENFPNVGWLNTEYFKIDEKNYSAKKAFLAKYPELKAYWDWKDKAEQADPEYLYYNQMQDAMYTKKSFTEKTPAELKPAQVAKALAVLDLDNFVKQDLLDYYVRKTELPYGTKAYLKDLWEQRGKPGSSFENFIDNLF